MAKYPAPPVNRWGLVTPRISHTPNRHRTTPERPDMPAVDPRHPNCRFRLKEEGRPYPRSGCTVCKATLPNLGDKCSMVFTESKADPQRMANGERNRLLNRTVDELDRVINEHDPDVHGPIKSEVWDVLDRMAVALENLPPFPAVDAGQTPALGVCEEASLIRKALEPIQWMYTGGGPYPNEPMMIFRRGQERLNVRLSKGTPQPRARVKITEHMVDAGIQAAHGHAAKHAEDAGDAAPVAFDSLDADTQEFVKGSIRAILEAAAEAARNGG